MAYSFRTARTPWLRDGLPKYVSASRILFYEYNSIVVYEKDIDTFIGKVTELLEAIRIERDGPTESRPIHFADIA